MVGTSWRSPEGIREVVGCLPDGRYLVTIPGIKARAVVPLDDLATERRRDAANVQSRARFEATRKREEQEQREQLDINGYGDSLPPHRQARVITTLNKHVSVNGDLRPLKDHIQKMVRDNATLTEHATFGKVLQLPAGGFFDKAALTKTGLDYAEHLIATTERT